MDENCGICQSSLAKGKTKIIHKNDKMWEHKFHSACIDQWILTCKNTGKPPNCPLCPDFEIPANKIPKKMKNIVFEDEPVIYNDLPDEYRSEIVARERHEQIMIDQTPLCMGMIIHVGNRRLLHCLNTSSGIPLDWTLQEVKNYVLRLDKQVYDATGKFAAHNIMHNLSLSNWVQWKYPELRITDVHYGVPSCKNRFDKFDITLDDNKTVDQMYIEYQTLLRENIKRGDLSYEVREKMKNVYYEQELWHYGFTGPDDPGSAEYGFCDPDNPEIPLIHRSEKLMVDNMFAQSTKHSLMWLIVHTEYV